MKVNIDFCLIQSLTAFTKFEFKLLDYIKKSELCKQLDRLGIGRFTFSNSILKSYFYQLINNSPHVLLLEASAISWFLFICFYHTYYSTVPGKKPSTSIINLMRDLQDVHPRTSINRAGSRGRPISAPTSNQLLITGANKLLSGWRLKANLRGVVHLC